MISFNGREYRNLEELVLKNTNDITGIKASASFLGAKIVGYVSDSSDLPSSWVGVAGDCYAVGEEAPWDIYSWTYNEDDDQWVWFYLGQWPLKGDTGEQGPAGEDGTNGTNWYVTNGIPVGDAYDDMDCALNVVNGNVYQFNTPTWIYKGSIKGPKGDKGDKGDKGNTGNTGATGATGALGPQGEIGPCPSILPGTVNTITGTAGDTAGCTIDVREVGTDNIVAYAIDFDFIIPEGEKGDKGDTGATGEGIDTWSALDISQAPTSKSVTANTNTGVSWNTTGVVTYGTGSEETTEHITTKVRVPIRPASDITNFLSITTDTGKNWAEIHFNKDNFASAAGLMYTADFNDEIEADDSFNILKGAVTDITTDIAGLWLAVTDIASDVAIIDGELTQAVTDIDTCEASITALNTAADSLQTRIAAVETKAVTKIVDNVDISGVRFYNWEVNMTSVNRMHVRVTQTTAMAANRMVYLYGYRISGGSDLSIMLAQIPNAASTSVSSTRYIVFDLTADTKNNYYTCYGSSSISGTPGTVYPMMEGVNFNTATKQIYKFRVSIGASGDVWPDDTKLDVWYT